MSEQRTPEWHAERVGKLTASMLHRAIAKTKTGWGAERDSYMAELLVERLTKQPYPHYVNRAMQFGTDTEPQARAAYAFERDVDVIECGFIPHPTIAMSGCSPDGRVGADGLVEFKCPESAEHLRVLRTGKIQQKYIVQTMWQLSCTGRDWCDWVSFDPRMPAWGQLYIARITHSDGMIELLEKQAREFLAELDRAEADLEQYYKRAAAA
jgi:putative phage-type endonuclease